MPEVDGGVFQGMGDAFSPGAARFAHTLLRIGRTEIHRGKRLVVDGRQDLARIGQPTIEPGAEIAQCPVRSELGQPVTVASTPSGGIRRSRIPPAPTVCVASA